MTTSGTLRVCECLHTGTTHCAHLSCVVDVLRSGSVQIREEINSRHSFRRGLSRIPLPPYWASRQAYKIAARKKMTVRIRRISRRMRTSYAQLRPQAFLSPVGPGVRHDTQGSLQPHTRTSRAAMYLLRAGAARRLPLPLAGL